MKAKTNNIIKMVVDVVMTILLLFLMAFQVTVDMLHEWLGIGMTALLIVHHILNRKWYGAVFKGKYNPYRIVLTAINALLLLSIVITALSGMAMSGHAVPFMYGFIGVMTARRLHLAFSYWSFIFMGIHIGLHIKLMITKLDVNKTKIFNAGFSIVSGIGLWLFLKNGILTYILFRTHFAFLDYKTPKPLVILGNLTMLILFGLIGYTAAMISQKKDKKYPAKPLLWLLPAAVIGAALYFLPDLTVFDKSTEQTNNGSWQIASEAVEISRGPAIAKLAPQSNIGEGLSVHYSGGAELENDIAQWLDKNGIRKN